MASDDTLESRELTGDLRDHIARVLETIARDGLPGPRDLDVALDAIGCAIYDDCDWRPIETAPKDQEIDLWVSGPGPRRISDCRWGNPSYANWGDRYGDDQNLRPQWITRSGSALDRRNGVPTHWMPLPPPPHGNEGEA